MFDLPSRKKAGDILGATDVNRIIGGVERADNLQAGKGVSIRKSTTGSVISAIPSIGMDMPAQLAWAENKGENDLGVYRPAGITGQIFKDTADTENNYLSQLILEVVDPQEDDENLYDNKFVICAENIPAGSIGQVWINGMCPAWAVVEDEDFETSELVGTDDFLTGVSAGSSQIVWVASGSEDEQIIFINIGNAEPVRLTIDVINKSGEIAPEGGFAEVYDWENGYFFFRKPTLNNSLTCYILTADIEADQTGEAWDRGITSGAILEAGAGSQDLVGSVSDQWYGRVSVGGTFVAVAPDYFQSL